MRFDPRGLRSALAIVVLLLIAILAIVLARANPLVAVYQLLAGALGGPSQIAETLVQSTALLFPALGVALAFRARLFNIGAEGQILIGALAATLVGLNVALPGFLLMPLVLAAGIVAGGVWGGIAGFLRARFGGSEVIATLMLNVIALFLANYLVSGPFKSPDAEGPETGQIAAAAWLPVLVPGTRLSIALFIGLALAFALRYVLARTVFGYELRASGDAPAAAARAGISLQRTTFLAMTLSGAIAGLGGATYVDGALHRFTVTLSPGYGFIAIAVALVGGLDPLRIVGAALLFGILQSGQLTMQAFANVPQDVITVAEGLAILGLAARQFAIFRAPVKVEA